MMTTKVNITSGGGDASVVHEAEAAAAAAAALKSMRLRGLAEGGGQSVEKKEKRKFWIALSKEEIEEDIFIMTGSRPARRPKKCPNNVQKNLDSVFPALWLVGFSADAYRAADAPAKSRRLLFVFLKLEKENGAPLAWKPQSEAVPEDEGYVKGVKSFTSHVLHVLCEVVRIQPGQSSWVPRGLLMAMGGLLM